LGIKLASRPAPREPLHGELDVLRLDLAPAFDLGLEPILRVALKYSLASLRAAVRSRVNFSQMKGSF
jgi:hypothetical protein